jgi:RimJ/RimL family protein N-acetyltransferase
MRQYSYSGYHDLARLSDFLMRARQATPIGFMHVGDLNWHAYQHVERYPQRDIRIWEDDRGDIIGFVEFSPKSLYFDPQIAPWAHEYDALALEMIAWSIQHARTHWDIKSLEASVMSSDERLQAILLANGFVADNDWRMYYNERELSVSIPAPTLIDGAILRHVADERDFDERVSIHREVWHPSKVTLEGYRLTRAAPGYDPTLDVVVELPDRTFAAYCVGWLDALNRIGEFEPVGTRAAHRRKGYGQAVLYEGMRRMQAAGMTKACVYCMPENLAFYGSVGFEPRAYWMAMHKQI